LTKSAQAIKVSIKDLYQCHNHIISNGGESMCKVQPIVILALKAVALAMAVASVVLSAINAATFQVTIVLLGVGLFALALASLLQAKD